MKKRTKLLVISSVFAITGVGIAVASTGAFNDGIGGVLPLKAAQHDSTHHLKEKAYEAPTYTKEGFKPYYLCEECCGYGPEEARYSFTNNETKIALSDIEMNPLTQASAEDVATGDMISTINTAKFKYVDQGANGVDGKEGESTPVYVKDGDKTALFFSRSGKNGEAYNAEANTNCSEFRFSVSSMSAVSSATFSYRYLDYGKGTWIGGDNGGQPLGAHSIVQIKDGSYYGKDVAFENDDQWHTMTLNYADYDTAGNKEYTTKFTDLIFKFVDLRGHFYISNLSFAEAPVTVTLKNATANGTDLTESVAKGSMPTTIPTIEGKAFAGWYDEEGNKVEAINGTTTLVARWTVKHYNKNNEMLLKFENDASKYGKPEGCDWQWATRGSDREYDISQNWYLDDEGSQGFLYPSSDEAVAGIVLPAYDFSNSPAIQFNFGFGSGIWTDVYVNNVACGQDAAGQAVGTKWKNFTVTIDGKTMVVNNAFESKNITIELSDDVYYGRTGIEIKTTKAAHVWFMLFPFISLQCDYVTTCQAIEAELPETISIDYKDKLEEYKTLRENFSDYENSQYPISEKMQTWIESFPKTILSFPDNGQSIMASAIGDTGNISYSADTIKNIKSGTAFNVNFDPFNLDEESIIVQINGLSSSYVTFTLPTVDFSAYKEVTFTFGFGANSGGLNGSWALGNVPDRTTDLKTAPTYIGTSIDTSNKKWTSATDFKAVISDGKISFSNSGGVTDKTFELANDIYTGEKGLTLTFGNVNWEIMVISPLTGSKI